MKETASKEMPALRALLIGIDHYQPNHLPNGSSYEDLGGCVRDVGRVEAYLTGKLGVPDVRIRRLTSSTSMSGGELPAEPPADRPTYDNIVKALKQIAEDSQPGDQIYLHYSGHGGRARTRLSAVKGEKALDECFVPCDLGVHEIGYLRDYELYWWLQRMARRGVFVTAVLDCCHSGGGARRPKQVDILRPRGIAVIDDTPRPAASGMADMSELAATWNAVPAGDTLASGSSRAVKAGPGWFRDARGYVVLAACRQDQFAYETSWDDGQVSGALTHWWLRTLYQAPPRLTYSRLYSHLLGRIESRFSHQTPMIEGEGDRLVFGASSLPSLRGVAVVEVEQRQAEGQDVQHVTLQTGLVQGVEIGAVFALHAPDDTQRERPICRAEVFESDADRCRAETLVAGTKPVEVADQAILVDPGARVRATFCLDPESLGQDAHRNLDDRFRRELTEGKERFLDLVAPDTVVDFRIGVAETGTFEIRTGTGHALDFHPPAPTPADGDAVPTLLTWLCHLAKYRNVRDLENSWGESSLRAFNVEFGRLPVGSDPKVPRPEVLEPGDTEQEVVAGEHFCLRFHNKTAETLHVTALSLDSRWRVGKAFPKKRTHTLDAGEDDLVPFIADLDVDQEGGEELLRIFATTGVVDFRWLMLPTLGEKMPAPRGRPINPLERLLAAVGSQGSSKRMVTSTSEELLWTVRDVRLKVTGVKTCALSTVSRTVFKPAQTRSHPLMSTNYTSLP